MNIRWRQWCSAGLIGAGLVLSSCGGGGGADADVGLQTIDQTALPLVTQGEDYSARLSASGGSQPKHWEVAAGGLPDGLTLDGASGQITGRATQLGRFDVAVTVRDAAGRQSRATVRMDVIEAGAPLPPDGRRAARQAAGATASQGSADLTGLLTLLAGMPEGSWVQASLNSYADVWTPEELRPLDVNGMGPTAPSKIIGAWSGFAWDSNRGDLILYGGGHANHPGNDVYRWRGSTRLWERAALPSEITRDAGGNFTAVDGPDAAPASAHTYDNNLFLPIVDRFLTFGGAAYNNGGAYRRATTNGQSRNTGPYLWDPAKADPNKVGGTTGSHVQRVSPHPEIVGGQMWQNRDFTLNLAGNPLLPGLHLEGCTGYAVENGVDVVYVGAHFGYGTATILFRYAVNDINNPKADSWTQIGGYWNTPQGQTVCAYDPVQHVFLRLGNATMPFTFWNAAAPGGNSNVETVVAFTEPTGEFAAKLANGLIDVRYCGLDFDPVRRQYAIWCGGGDVWLLSAPPTLGATGWRLQKQVAAASAAMPTTATGTGILGKWKYIPNLDAFMALQDSTLGNIWIYKPVGWKSPGGGDPTNQAPVVSLAAPLQGAQFNAGATIQLLATAIDPDGSVSRVDFYDGAVFLATGVRLPDSNQWSYAWNSATAGSHTISARAVDNAGAQGTSATVTIQVLAANQPPTISLSTPANGQLFTSGQVIALLANAADADGSVTAVDFYDGATRLARVSLAPWRFDWSAVALGPHALSAVAYDNQGASRTSAVVTIQVLQASAGTVVLQDGAGGYTGTRDTYLLNGSGNTYYGTGTATHLVDNSIYHAMMARFAIFNREGGPVPDNALIVSANLELYKSTYYSLTLSAYRLLCDWQETQAAWNVCRTGVPWVTPGALGAGTDYVATEDGAGLAGWNPGWVKIDVTKGLAAMQGGAPNFGWRLRRTAGDDINTKRYFTREYIDASLRPKLTVTYNLP